MHLVFRVFNLPIHRVLNLPIHRIQSLPMLHTNFAEEKSSQHSRLKVRFPQETWRAVSIINAPYCISLSSHPVDNDCIVGVSCIVPDTRENDTKWRHLCCSGLAVDLLTLIANDWHIKFKLYIAEDGAFGGVKNGTWNGIINEVYSDKADIGIQGITQTSQRQHVLDFSVGFQHSHFAIIRRTIQEENLSLWKFLDPLENLLLVMVVVTGIIVQIVLFFFENVGVHLSKTSGRFLWQDVFAYTTGLIFQRDIGGRNPISIYGRLSALTFAVCMTVIMSTYTAELTANNIHNPMFDDFAGINDQKV